MEKIGAGGMAQIFEARHRRMDRLVAVKLLSSPMTKDLAAIACFEREVKAAARLHHLRLLTLRSVTHLILSTVVVAYGSRCG